MTGLADNSPFVRDLNDDAFADLAFYNIVVGEVKDVLVYALVAFALIGVYALVVFFQCRKNDNVKPENKIGWLVFIGVSPFMYGIGAAVYGLIHYKNAFKIVPVVFLAGVLLFSVKVMYKSLDSVERMAVTTIEENVSDVKIRTALIEDVRVLREEASFFGKGRNSFSLMSHVMSLTTVGDIDYTQYEDWRELYERRAKFSQMGLGIAQAKSQFNAGIREGMEEYDTER